MRVHASLYITSISFVSNLKPQNKAPYHQYHQWTGRDVYAQKAHLKGQDAPNEEEDGEN